MRNILSGYPERRRLAALSTLVLLGNLTTAWCQVLTLDRAETLALADNPSVERLLAERRATAEDAVAAGELPDPRLKFGAIGVPVDSFELGQEPMTQVQVGVVQAFPPGNTRQLRSEQALQRATALEARAVDQQLRILQSVRETYVALFAEARARRLLLDTRAKIAELRDLVLDYYGTGRAAQQEVLRAEVELARIEERLARTAQNEARLRGQLAAWITEAAWEPLPERWPEFPELPARSAVVADLAGHPAVDALEAELAAADLGIDVAREQYKPGVSVDLTYGARAGTGADGRGRPDLLSAMVMVDLPVFRDRRQDRTLAASQARYDAATEARADLMRRLRAMIDGAYAALDRLDQRLGLFDDRLLPDAGRNTEAALDAYQSAVGDLTALMRAEITEYELQLEHLRARAERLQLLAQILYLEGRS